MFADLVIETHALRGTGYTARDVGAAYRRLHSISPLVHNSLMKRAVWQLVEATDDELAEMGLTPHRRSVYDLADAVAAALEDVDEDVTAELRRRLVERFEELNIYPRDPEDGI